MAFELKKFLGTEESNWESPAAVESITKGECVYWASGYIGRGYASVTCALLAGVAMQTVDNSGGSVGTKTVQHQPSPLAIYDVGTSDVMSQALVGLNVPLASASTVIVATSGTEVSGVFKIMKMISASKVRGRFNFSSGITT